MKMYIGSFLRCNSLGGAHMQLLTWPLSLSLSLSLSVSLSLSLSLSLPRPLSLSLSLLPPLSLSVPVLSGFRRKWPARRASSITREGTSSPREERRSRSLADEGTETRAATGKRLNFDIDGSELNSCSTHHGYKEHFLFLCFNWLGVEKENWRKHCCKHGCLRSRNGTWRCTVTLFSDFRTNLLWGKIMAAMLFPNKACATTAPACCLS